MQALRKENVKVMLINPGPVATAMTEVNMAPKKCTIVSVNTKRGLASAHHTQQLAGSKICCKQLKGCCGDSCILLHCVSQ